MVKREIGESKKHKAKKSQSPEPEFIEEITMAVKNTENEIKALVTENPQKSESKDKTEKIRNELIEASEDGTIPQIVEYLKKCYARVIEKINAQYETKKQKEADIYLTDLFISQFSSVLGGLDAIESPEELSKELGKNPVLKKDSEKVMSTISPYIPLIGIIGATAIIGKHVYKNYYIKKNKELEKHSELVYEQGNKIVYDELAEDYRDLSNGLKEKIIV